MSNIVRIMQRAAAGANNIPDAVLSSVLAEAGLGGSSSPVAVHITKTNDPTKFLIFYWRTNYYRGRVLTLTGSNLSIGSENTFVLNQSFSSFGLNSGMRWDSASGAAIGVVIDDGNDDTIRVIRVTYSGTSMSHSIISSSIDDANSYRLPRTGASCLYNSTNNVYFAIYTDANSGTVYAKPFTVSGSSVTLGTRRSIASNPFSGGYANSVWVNSTSTLYTITVNYSSGSGQYSNIVTSSTYSGGTNGTFTIASSSTFVSNTQGATGNIVYNPEENVVYLISQISVGGAQRTLLFPSTPSSGSLSIGTSVYLNPTNFTVPSSSSYSAYGGALYDPISKAIIVQESYSQYLNRFVQVRSVGNVMSEQQYIGTFFNSLFVPEAAEQSAETANGPVVLDGNNNRTLLVLGNTKDPSNFPAAFISALSLTP